MEGLGSIPDLGTKILQATSCGKKKNTNKIIKKIEMQNVKSQLGIKICILTVSLGDLYVN